MARSLWPAVYALRTAESIANLATVTGAADAPPATPEDEESWAKEWLTRARAALSSAGQMVAAAADAAKPANVAAELRERAQRIAENVRVGVKNIRERAKKAAKTLREDLLAVNKTAGNLLEAVTAGEIALTVTAVIAALWWFTRSK
jgi:hypothetical protein